MRLKNWENVGKGMAVVTMMAGYVLVVEAFCWAFFSPLALRPLIGVSVLSGVSLIGTLGALGMLVKIKKVLGIIPAPVKPDPNVN